MPYAKTIGFSLAITALLAAALPAPADPLGDQVHQVRDAVVPSTVIVSYAVQRDDGSKPDIHLMGTVVGPGNLVMFASVAIPSGLSVSQFKDFRVIVSKGDEQESFVAEYLGKDDESQVAFLRVTDPKAPALPPLAFESGVDLAVGDPVVTFSHLGEPDRYERLARLVRISGRVDQPVTAYVTIESLGSPGTPVVTLDGKAMGIVGLVQINRNTNARPNWTTMEVVWPAERFVERIKNLPKGGAIVHHAWLGAYALTPVTRDLAAYFKMGERRGVVVGQIVEKSPAEKARLAVEDVILAVGGKDIKGTEGQLVESFMNDVRARKPGETVTLTVWRGGKTQDLKVTLEAEPKTAAEAERYRSAPVGLLVREMVLADSLLRELPASETGVVVAHVTSASWAADAGLKADDVVKKVQDQDTPTLAEFRKVFDAEVKKRPKEIVLFVLRGKKDTQLVRIETRWSAAPPAKAAPAAPAEKTKAETPAK
ncbi:MAG: PDZ domain-containing protein [Planctomycetota bacterium]|nr:PDZ domain-containing protein [Planctomycetota bacterium]